MTVRRFRPTQWLLCSAAAFDTIVRDPGVRHAGGPLLHLRLDSGHLRRLTLDRLEPLLRQVAREQAASQQRLVLDAPEDIGIRELQRLAGLGAELRVHFWRDQATEVLASLDAPDDAVLDTWRGVLDRDPGVAALQLPADIDAGWLAAYRAALRVWSERARDEHGAAAFDEAYPPRLFDWGEFEADHGNGDRTGLRYRHRLLPLLSFLALSPSGHRLEGLLRQAPLERADQQVLQLRGPAANAPDFALRRQLMRGGRVLAARGTLPAGAFELTVHLPARAGLDLRVDCRMGWRLAFGVGAVELGVGDASSAAAGLVRLGPPLPWRFEAHSASFSMLAPCSDEALRRLDVDPTPALWLRRLPDDQDR